MDYEGRYTGPQIDEGIGKANDAVLTTPQELDEGQKEIARLNIGAGDYSQPEGGIPETDLAAALRIKINGKLNKAVEFGVPYEKYLTIPAGMYNLAVIVGYEDYNYQPIFVTSDNLEMFKVATLDNRELPFDIMRGRIDDTAVLALRNNLSDDTIPAFVRVLLLAGDMPEIKVGTAADFDDEPELLADVRNLYAKPSSGIPALDMASEVQTLLGKAETSLQPVSGATSGNFAGLNAQGKVVDSGKKTSDFASSDLVPVQASAQNQLADKAFVNSSVQTATANFRGNYGNLSAVPDYVDGYPQDYAGGRKPTTNDYMVVGDATIESWDETKIYETDNVPVFYDERCWKCISSIEDPGTPPSEDSEHWKRWIDAFIIEDGYRKLEGTWRFKYTGDWDRDGVLGWQPEYQVNEKPLTAAQLAAINSGITDAKVAKLDALPATIPTEVFWVEYGVTTYQQIVDAVTAGKLPCMLYGNSIYTYQTYSSYAVTLYNFSPAEQIVRRIDVLSSNNSYLSYNSGIQFTNRVFSWSSTPSNNTYPSEKLVYDSLYKRGVISQTQTWTQAADGGYDYVMSALVYGDIPRYFIDLVAPCGASFNATTGYFELNGLTDISYEEMLAIYNYGTSFFHTLENRFRAATIRTNIKEPWEGDVNPNIMYSNANVSTMFYTSRLEVAHIFSQKDGTSEYFAPVTMSDFIRYSSFLKEVDGIIDVTNRVSIVASFLYSAPSLEDVRIFGLRANITIPLSPRLSVASILYMINNEAATSAITITLHATAYARATADADITAALQNHPNITLVSA